MKKKMSKILIYASNEMTLHDDLKIEVDDKGEEWLSPNQVDYLETMHLRSRYTLNNLLKASGSLVQSYTLPAVKSEEYSGAVPKTLLKSTPMSPALSPL